MKNTLVKQRGEGGELKRKHEATLSKFEKLQKAFTYLEWEKDALVISVTITEGEKKDLESKILELETQRSTINRQIEELRTRVEELEEQNRILENQLKAANER